MVRRERGENIPLGGNRQTKLQGKMPQIPIIHRDASKEVFLHLDPMVICPFKAPREEILILPIKYPALKDFLAGALV